MPYQFLSDEWVAEARKIRAEFKGLSAPVTNPLRINLVISEVPDSGSIDAHIDTSGGEPDIERGHLESPDVTVTLDYDTAKALVVEGNGQAAMSAFMAGKLRVDGDMAKLMGMQGTGALCETEELAARIREITA
ncbi:MAG: SCP2 sterol-binding domain-containing protein [Acidimicrobiales bacterium]